MKDGIMQSIALSAGLSIKERKQGYGRASVKVLALLWANGDVLPAVLLRIEMLELAVLVTIMEGMVTRFRIGKVGGCMIHRDTSSSSNQKVTRQNSSIGMFSNTVTSGNKPMAHCLMGLSSITSTVSRMITALKTLQLYLAQLILALLCLMSSRLAYVNSKANCNTYVREVNSKTGEKDSGL